MDNEEATSKHPIGEVMDYAGQVPATQQRTLAARLEDAIDTISGQCGNIEDALARINGTPRTPQTNGPEKIVQGLRVTSPLAQSVDTAEIVAKRICELAHTLDRVA